MSNLKRSIQKLSGYWIYRARYLPRGTDLLWDIERLCGRDSLGLVLDVGANVGQFTLQIRRHFNRAKIHCFEPVTETFVLLTRSLAHDKMAECHKLAIADSVGEKVIFVNPDRTESSLNYCYGEFSEEVVETSSIDAFCRARGINSIDLMKVDTEGSDLQVLRGAVRMLKDQAIKFLFVETELLQSDRHFIPLTVLADFLKDFGYEMIAIYDQRHHWDGRQGLSFCNVLFGSSRIIAN